MNTKTVNIIKNIAIIVLSLIIAFLIAKPFLFDDTFMADVTNRVSTERKFLVHIDDLPWDKIREGTTRDIVQSYISFVPEIRLRNTNGSDFQFSLRTPIDDELVSRQIVEFRITEDEYNELFQKISGLIIHKTRYQFEYNGIDVRVDVFLRDLRGLVFAEVNFDSVEEANSFVPPAWFGEDVTTDERYRNAMLSRDGLPVNS
jgi:CYTH domain-containing protein